jgi:hypothetical protein
MNDYGRSAGSFVYTELPSYTHKTGGFDAVPKDAFMYLYNGTILPGLEYDELDLTNRFIEVTYSVDNNIDYYPLSFLVDDARFSTTDTYGYIMLSDMTPVGSYNTGLLSPGREDYNLTTNIIPSRYYLIDANITLDKTSTNKISSVGIGFNNFRYYDLIRVHEPNETSFVNIMERKVMLGYRYNNDAYLNTPSLISYPGFQNRELEYVNMRILVDMHNHRISTNMRAKWEILGWDDAGWTSWQTLESTVGGNYIPRGDSITSFFVDVYGDSTAQVMYDIYRQPNVPSITSRPADNTFSNAKRLDTPILREGENKLLLIYNNKNVAENSNIIEWTYNVNMIGGEILGIPPTILPQPNGDTGALLPDDYQIFSGIIPNFMGTPQNTTMFIALILMVLVLIIGAIIGASAGMLVVGFFVGLGFVFMLAIYFALIGWLPAWIPIIAFVMTSLIGANSIRNAFTGTGGQ